MLSRCPRRLSKVASPALRDASCSATKYHPSAALFLSQRRGFNNDRNTESYSDQLAESSQAESHKQKETQNDFSFDNSLTELFGDTPIRSKSSESNQPRPRRQTLTKSEQDVLTGMLDMIVTPPPSSKTSRTTDDSQPSTSSSTTFSSLSSGLFDRLRKVYKTSAQRSPDDVLFDQKKEQIGLCTDDAQLFEWTLREVFAESERFEAAARAVMDANAALPAGTPPQPVPPLQPPTYRRIIPHLMHVFRDQYRQPHLSVSIFRYAQRLSPASFVYGCSTEAYNELLETQWVLRDLTAVRDVLQEMHRHAVPLSAKTDGLVDRIRRELGRLQGETAAAAEQMRVFAEIEAEIARVDKSRKAQGREKDATGRWSAWKRQALEDTEGGFNDWSSLDGRDEGKARFRAKKEAEEMGPSGGFLDRYGSKELRSRPQSFERHGGRATPPFDSRNRRPADSRDRQSFDPRQRQTYGRPSYDQGQSSSRYPPRQGNRDHRGPPPSRRNPVLNEARDALELY
ncbi:hypothetical protein D9619_001720 [Psilocybe cf. subviscida]|uniref:Mtf2-like C-terminal domain-containing protein n=1 Tax=Psilocybe cf. subviscida TaxID=2480587 RepID=A0A8H5F2Q2_9AGAR|nr:hypothetical protein D9619_001720 [Psilocybe cf. subviscida]